MVNKNKAKGNAAEREFVGRCREVGLKAVRAWSSNGKALGEAQEVDCMLNGYKIQVKKGYNHPSIRLKDFLTNVDFCYWSASDKRKYPNSDYVFMTLDTFLQLVKKL